MSSEKLIKTLPTLQNQIDALLDFDVTTNDLNNGVINAAFMLLFRDLIRLFACYNDGIINLLGKFLTNFYKDFPAMLKIRPDFLKKVKNDLEFSKQFLARLIDIIRSMALHPRLKRSPCQSKFYLDFFFSEKYFDMNKKHARDALDLYKKFLIRMDRVADFLKVAEVRFQLPTIY